MSKIVVSEAGASVYSASAFASQELPDLDVTLRGAVSIARRLQDPLAELVKIDPKSIGVGQYQHDISETKLSRSLDAVVEDCVNAVGVDVNTASAPLLARVSGIGPGLAQNIVLHRDANGPFRSRKALKKVPRLGPEGVRAMRRLPAHCAMATIRSMPPAFTRNPIRWCGGSSRRAKSDIKALIGNADVLRELDAADVRRRHIRAADRHRHPARVGEAGPRSAPGLQGRRVQGRGRDARTTSQPGMVLEGAVTNVAAFGAFVDIGVHQDGLVHVSAMAKTFVKDPREIVKPGDIVRVKVLEVDKPRKRIALDVAARRRGRQQGRAYRSTAQGRQPLTVARADAQRRSRARAVGRWRACGCAAQGGVFRKAEVAARRARLLARRRDPDRLTNRRDGPQPGTGA